MTTLTNGQKIGRLAAFMGWDHSTQNDGPTHCPTCGDNPKWNPLESWDDWRMVEEKVMENDDLFAHYMAKVIAMQWQKEKGNTISISGRRGGVTFRRTLSLMKANLPTRVDALLSVLPPQK